MHGPLLSWTERITRLPVAVRVTAILFALFVVTLVDHVTGPDFTLNFMYSLVVMSAAWIISHRWGIIVAGLATGAALEVNVLAEREEGWLVLVANNLLRGGGFLLFVVLTTAIRNSVLHLVDSTRLDAMTGILSRRGFLDELSAARRRALQRQTPLGVVYLDLDGLKEVNDNDGHAAGDALIRKFVQGAGGHLRATDVFGRLGGDEFAIVLERADPLVIDGVVSRIVNDPDIPHVSCVSACSRTASTRRRTRCSPVRTGACTKTSSGAAPVAANAPGRAGSTGACASRRSVRAASRRRVVPPA